MSAITPLPLALPAPAWCTQVWHPFNGELHKLTDVELERQLTLHDQFYDYILTRKGCRPHLWAENKDGAREVALKIKEEIAGRWLLARHKARCQAERRRYNAKFSRPAQKARKAT